MTDLKDLTKKWYSGLTSNTQNNAVRSKIGQMYNANLSHKVDNAKEKESLIIPSPNDIARSLDLRLRLNLETKTIEPGERKRATKKPLI